MIDEFTLDASGWARFSEDRKFRYRLGRSLVPGARLSLIDGRVLGLSFEEAPTLWTRELIRIVFLMLNPSTADAFKVDPTVNKCCQFAVRWGAHIIEVVNLFALRSPDPKSLDAAVEVGDDMANDQAILDACTGASRVIAAWGNNGHRWGRGNIVADRLKRAGIELLHLGMTGDGFPLHPLARGKAFIPLTREPILWSST